MSIQLDEQAVGILQKNDRGGYTIPTARLYPYQWNWDSAFVALGFMTFDRDRAWQELELLFEGQWRNGMIPSIIFRRNDPDYFPGPSVWQTTDTNLPSTGLSQPPVLASIVHTLVESGDSGDRQRAAALFEKLISWHRWFHEERVTRGNHKGGHTIVATVHPWESGRDNCPDWELGLQGMAIDSDLQPYVRKDIEHADPAQRPSQEQYDKYITIVKAGRELHWDQKKFTSDGPFLMADPGIHFILLRADKDLLKLAITLELNQYEDEIRGWVSQGLEATDYLWNDAIGAFCARNVKTGEFSNGVSSASVLCFYADSGSDSQKAATLRNMQEIETKINYMMPSWDPRLDSFEPQRYWCGPVWPQMNYIIAKGLAEQGYTVQSERIKNDMAALIQKSGFHECFDPLTGEGCIGVDFSWTAAIWLAWASPNRSALAA